MSIDSTQNPGTEPGAEGAPETGTAPVDPEDRPFGSTKGEALSLVLFALMVVIGSACFVIW